MTTNYEAPRIDDLGSVANVTRGESTGIYTDRDFPRGTDPADLTFSS